MRFANLAMTGVFLAFGLIENAHSYDKNMHSLVNRRIYEESTLCGTLQNDLGVLINMLLPNPTLTGSELKTPDQLFRDAGPAEDDPITRAWNHYHDPLVSWDAAGFNKIGFPVFPVGGRSSVLWAQGYPPVGADPNSWSWGNAYSFFLAGITSSSPSTRDWNLANMITALGHLTHLTADISVPEHTRNDGHILYNYETWCETYLYRPDLPAFRNAFGPDNAIFGVSRGQYNNAVLSPVSNLWDSNPLGLPQNPNPYNQSMYADPRVVGLADYSNFNYFSGDTVFKDYRFPEWDESKWKPSPVLQRAKDGKYDNVLYFRGVTSDGVVVRPDPSKGSSFTGRSLWPISPTTPSGGERPSGFSAGATAAWRRPGPVRISTGARPWPWATATSSWPTPIPPSTR